MTEITIGGRVIPLYYSTYELVEIQKEIGCTAYELNDQVFGLRTEVDEETGQDKAVHFDVGTDPARQEKLGKLIRILGNAGLEESGQEADLTDKWVLRKMKPGLVLAYAFAVIAVITEGNKIEATKEENGPVDEGLEEENAKKQQGK